MKCITTCICLLTLCVAFGQNEPVEFTIDDIYGTWRIDSTAEDGTYNKRTSVLEEFFVFQENGKVNMEVIEEGTLASNPFGTFTLVADTLKIRTLKGAPGINFVITMTAEVLQLESTFPISDLNSRKATAYLSRKKSEESTISIFRPDSRVLYRNVINEITITPLAADQIVECPYCDTIYKGEIANQYFLKPGRGRMTEVIIREISTSKVLEKHTLTVTHLPDPTLFYGITKNGGKCSKQTQHIFAKYPPEVNLDVNSAVMKWEIHIDAHTFTGDGNTLSEELLTFLKNYAGDGVISVIAFVLTADGIQRKIGGVFSL